MEDRLIKQQIGATQRWTYAYDGDELRRSAHNHGESLTTMIWDGEDYLGEV